MVPKRNGVWEDEEMRYTVTVLPAAVTLQVPKGSNLLDVLRAAEVAPEAPCGGYGTCHKCKVIVNGLEKLACRTLVESDMVVTVPEKAETRILTGGEDVKAVNMDPVKPGYLIAFDIGTTTVVCFLLDGKTGEELANASMLNPQSPYGADVISRIQAALNGQMEEITQVIRDGMTALIRSACAKGGVDPEQVGVVAVVGNPCMQQLFMGIDPRNLVAIPFGPVITEAGHVPCADYLPVCPNAEFLIVPDISGYVGADTMGCVLSTRMYESDEVTLMVDIGTNGEMVLGNKDRMTACSTAAGPALEGAKIKFGMRGAPGAIDHVWVEDGVIRASVIGGGKAQGICGSGLIDAVAVALETGLINKRGRIVSKEERDGDRFIDLIDGVYLTQNDIREVQLAKGAIAAGIQLMARELGMKVEDIDRVLLAGAFGNFMNPRSACRIGLLPPSLINKVTGVGNAAGVGSRLVACSREELDRTQELVGKIEFIELAAIPAFQMTFARCMSFDDELKEDD